MSPAVSPVPRRQYPRRYHTTVRSVVRSSLWTMGLTGLPALGLDLAAVYGHGSLFLAALASAVFLLGLIAASCAMVDCRTARVIPYFPRRVGEIETFLAGEAVAGHLPSLDEIAAHLGIPPLSSFGFADDLSGETLVWHDAAAGLRTVQTLAQALADTPGANRGTQQILEDLHKLEHALQRANAHAIPFCLLFLHGNSTSGHEWDVRQGTAF